VRSVKNDPQERPAAGHGLRLIRSVISRLPRGRARAAEILSRFLRTPFVDAVPPYDLDVRLLIDPRDRFQLEIWLGTYQPHVISFLRRAIRRGDRVLCAGLHIGYFAALARRLAGPHGLVLSAEPDQTARQRADENLRLSGGPASAPIHVLPAGLSDQDATLPLHKSTVLGHSSFGTPHQEQGIVDTPVRKGDTWLTELGVDTLDVLVLDVEGWELNALQGLRGTIARSSELRAMIEVSDWALRDAGTSANALLAFCWNAGLVVQWAEHADESARYGVTGSLARPNQELRANDVICFPSANPSPAAVVPAPAVTQSS
jgi:FkbM family methyltransferase